MNSLPADVIAAISKNGEVDSQLLISWFHGLPKAEQKIYVKHAIKLSTQQIAISEKRQEHLRWLIEALTGVSDDLRNWLNAPIVMGHPGASALHHLRQAILDNKVLFMNLAALKSPDEFAEPLSEAQCFLVEHDWASAFAGALDFAEGDFRLPYDSCLFEFMICGRRVMALMSTIDDRILMQIIMRCGDQWAVDDDICQHENGKWAPYHSGRSADTNCFQHLAEFIGAQVRAISVALDADVARHEVFRVSEKLVRSREKAGRIPPKPFHVVSLSRRSRSALPLPGEGGEHTKKRLHFRRGHWRHYESHKTWIKWMLVGNPDLGFVDKEYRL